jgi:hypothetical protein
MMAVAGLVMISIVQVGVAQEGKSISGTNSPLSLLYRFTGVSDDGEQGSTNRKEATSVHCTNVADVDVEIEVQLYQYNGTDVFTGTISVPPNRTFTFSTQNTTIYFEDVLIGGVPGTPAIFQGSGQIFTSSPDVFCTVQVLDPFNYPPTFMTKLPMFDRYGHLIKRTIPPLELYLPIIMD